MQARSVSPNGNSRFLPWERAFPLMGTSVSYCGNWSFLLWELEFPAVGTGVSCCGNERFLTWKLIYILRLRPASIRRKIKSRIVKPHSDEPP